MWGWVVFEDIFLCLSIRASLREMHHVAADRAELEALNALSNPRSPCGPLSLPQAKKSFVSSALRHRLEFTRRIPRAAACT